MDWVPAQELREEVPVFKTKSTWPSTKEEKEKGENHILLHIIGLAI